MIPGMPQEEIEREVEKVIAALRGLPGGTPVTDDDRKHVLEQLAAKSWNDLGVLEGKDGTLLLPWKIWRRDKDGKFAGKDVVLRVPDGPILRRARIEARQMAAEDHLDLDRDKDLVDDLEMLSILFWSVREPTEPHEPVAMDARDFERIFNREVLKQTNFALTHAQRIFSPKVGGMRTFSTSIPTPTPAGPGRRRRK